MKTFFPGADSLLFDKKGNLAVIQNKGVDKVFLLSSSDNWNTAEVKAATSIEDRFQNPSTGTWANGKIFALNSKLNELTDKSKLPSKEFSIQFKVGNGQ